MKGEDDEGLNAFQVKRGIGREMGIFVLKTTDFPLGFCMDLGWMFALHGMTWLPSIFFLPFPL